MLFQVVVLFLSSFSDLSAVFLPFSAHGVFSHSFSLSLSLCCRLCLSVSLALFPFLSLPFSRSHIPLAFFPPERQRLLWHEQLIFTNTVRATFLGLWLTMYSTAAPDMPFSNLCSPLHSLACPPPLSVSLAHSAPSALCRPFFLSLFFCLFSSVLFPLFLCLLLFFLLHLFLPIHLLYTLLCSVLFIAPCPCVCVTFHAYVCLGRSFLTAWRHGPWSPTLTRLSSTPLHSGETRLDFERFWDLFKVRQCSNLMRSLSLSRAQCGSMRNTTH